MLGNTTVGLRETSICKSSGHEEQHGSSLQSGWIVNAVACEEAWASNPGWYRVQMVRMETNDNGSGMMTTDSF